MIKRKLITGETIQTKSIRKIGFVNDAQIILGSRFQIYLKQFGIESEESLSLLRGPEWRAKEVMKKIKGKVSFPLDLTTDKD